MISINLTGRLTRDPELRQVPNQQNGGQLEVCQLRVAARDRRGDTVFLDVAEWGPSGRAAAQHLHKGSLVAFSGELRFREVQAEAGARQYISAVGHVEFLGGRRSEVTDDRAPSIDVEGNGQDDVEIPF
jgi:single-stranded DNA-binding protein